MTAKSRRYLEGILAANVEVARIAGQMKIGEMHEQTWDLVKRINSRLLEMASAEAGRLEQ